jgi:hypothetical protein
VTGHNEQPCSVDSQVINERSVQSLLTVQAEKCMDAKAVAIPAGGIERAFLVLRYLATAGKRGLGLIEIADKTRLPNSTVHRVLHRLQVQSIVSQDTSTKRYRLGRLAYEARTGGKRHVRSAR